MNQVITKAMRDEYELETLKAFGFGGLVGLVSFAIIGGFAWWLA